MSHQLTDQAVRLRIFAQGVVRHESWHEPESLEWAIKVIRDQFKKHAPSERYTIVGDRYNISAIIYRRK